MVLEKVTGLIGKSADNAGDLVEDVMDTTQDTIDDMTDLKPVHGAIGLATGLVSDVADAVKGQANIVRGLRR